MSAKIAPTIRVSRRYAASPERVFDAWLDPQTAGKWLFATDSGTMARVEIDARVGGRFTFVDRRDGEDIEHVGEYFELDRPRRLVFTFGVPKFSDQMTRVAIDIVPLDSGCELTLTHEGALSEWAERTEAGWGMILGGLADSLDSAPGSYGKVVAPGTVRFERLLPGPIERVWAYLVDSEKRGEWFASGELTPRVGGEATFAIDHDSYSPERAPRPDKFKDIDQVVTIPVRVTCFEPPHRLGFDWPSEGDRSETLFEMAVEGNKVRLTLTHSRLADRATMVDVSGGWHTHLAVLAERLHGRTPPAFWTLFGKVEEVYGRRYPRE